MWEEVVEKTVDTEAKASLQPRFKTRKIDFKCLEGYKLSAKKEKNKASQEHKNRNKNKAKFYNFLFVNMSQSQIQASKKNKCDGSYQKGHLVIEINVTKVAKKNKDKNKAKDLSYIKCYTFKQKDHYANKYSEKAKN